MRIDEALYVRYPDMAIGYLIVTRLRQAALAVVPVEVQAGSSLSIAQEQLTLQNLVEHRAISAWRRVYQSCGVKPKSFKSSVESLLRRYLQYDYKPISPIVDSYNYISAGFMLPVGGYDLDTIEGSLSLRFGKVGDQFIQLNGREDIAVTPDHIVYADESVNDSVVCWMWNHRDSRRTMLTDATDNGVFIFDCLTTFDRERVKPAMEALNGGLRHLGAQILVSGLIDQYCPEVFFESETW